MKILEDPEELFLRTFFVIKHRNAGKVSSHLWFFQGFCKLLNPDFCTLIDVGTQPAEDGVFNYFRALES